MFPETMERISTSYMEFLTDDFSIWQHSKGLKIDRRHGYALDDGARALIFVLNHGPKTLAPIYFKFLLNATLKGKIINFFDSEHKPLKIGWSEDALGQSYWALALWNKTTKEKIDLGKIEHLVESFQSIRGIAYALAGSTFGNKVLGANLFQKLLKAYLIFSTPNWTWIEKDLTYGNAIIPFSFLSYYRQSKDQRALENGLKMLQFLNHETKSGKTPIAIGNKGWYSRNALKSLFDQQPVDISYQVIANIEAYEITNQDKFLTEAIVYYSWFWGNNLLKKNMIDVSNQRCLDGLKSNSVSKNCGAESIICYLWAQEKIWPYLGQTKTEIPAYQKGISKNIYGDI